jgi:gliding motility-associated-like protein
MTDILPSGFTPNNDGLNDVFRLTNFKFQQLVQFSVYNRWGTEIFQTIDPKVGWDGTYMGVPQDIGVYNYQVIVAHPDGVNKTYKGTVTLVR